MRLFIGLSVSYLGKHFLKLLSTHPELALAEPISAGLMTLQALMPPEVAANQIQESAFTSPPNSQVPEHLIYNIFFCYFGPIHGNEFPST